MFNVNGCVKVWRLLTTIFVSGNLTETLTDAVVNARFVNDVVVNARFVNDAVVNARFVNDAVVNACFVNKVPCYKYGNDRETCHVTLDLFDIHLI
jgi:hypothetical protein